MCVNLTDFVNDKYLVLKTLYDNQVRVGSKTYIPLSQQRIADLVGFAKPKSNQLMQQLVSGVNIHLLRQDLM